MITQPTPPPWERNGNAIHKRISPHYATCVACFEGEDRYANAQLCLAVHDMLAVCNAIVQQEESNPNTTIAPIVSMARDAIAKAKGVA